MRKVSIAYRAVTKESGDRVGVVTWGGLSRYNFPLADAISLYNHYFMELFWKLREGNQNRLAGHKVLMYVSSLLLPLSDHVKSQLPLRLILPFPSLFSYL